MNINERSDADYFSKQMKIARAGFIYELVNLILSAITAVMSNTLIVWLDTFVVFSITVHLFLTMLVTGGLLKNIGDMYNYGTDRMESFVSFVCDLMIGVGLILMAGVSVHNLIEPEETSENIIWFLALKAVNIVIGIFLVIRQHKLLKAHHSHLAETELAVYEQVLIDHIVVGIFAVVCLIFRNAVWSWYLSPAVCLLVSVFHFVECIKRVRQTSGELADVSIPVNCQDEFYDIVLEARGNLKSINSVSCHVLNSNIIVDLDVTFRDEVTSRERQEWLKDVAAKIRTGSTLPVSSVRIVEDEPKE